MSGSDVSAWPVHDASTPVHLGMEDEIGGHTFPALGLTCRARAGVRVCGCVRARKSMGFL